MNLEKKVKHMFSGTRHALSKSIALLSLVSTLSLTPSCGTGEESIEGCQTDYDCPGYSSCFLGECQDFNPQTGEDGDGDGYKSLEFGGDDCNDNDPKINPGMSDLCDDGVDNNCDGVIDENCSQKIAYVDSSGKNDWGYTRYDIVMLKNDGTFISSWLDVDEEVKNLSCSPQGQWLAYQVRSSEIWLGVIDYESVIMDWEERFTQRYSYPNWSPLGDRLVFTYNDSEIAYVKMDELQEIINLTNPENKPSFDLGFFCHDPAWSSDGGSVVFLSDKESPNSFYLHTVNVNTLEITKFSSISGIQNPDFCPDGSLVYDKSSGIYHLKDNLETKIYSSGEHPKCSPDGKEIVFDKDGIIYKITLDATGLTKVSDEGVYGQYPDWCL